MRKRLEEIWVALKKLDFGIVQALHLLVEIRDLVRENQDQGTAPTTSPASDEFVSDKVFPEKATGTGYFTVSKRELGRTPVPLLKIRPDVGSCPDCGWAFKSRRALDLALRRARAIDDPNTCPICGRERKE